MEPETTYPDIISYFKEYNGDYFNEIIQSNKYNADYQEALEEQR